MSNQIQTAQNSKTAAKKPPVQNQEAPAKKGVETDDELRSLGGRPSDAPQVSEVSTIDETPSVNAGQPGFEMGETMCGYYLGTKTVISTKTKKPNWKDLDTNHPAYIKGAVFRLQHKFLGADGKPFGIWGAGSLDYVLPRLRRGSLTEKGQYLELTYTGQATEALKAGQSPPHTFKFKSNEPLALGVDVDGAAPAVSEAAVN